MPPTWKPDFDFYMTMIDDKPASIVVDLAAAAAAPVESHPVLLGIRVPMLKPRADGLRDGDELDALAEIEDRFTEKLVEEVDALYAGRIVHDGDTTLYYYAPLAHRQRLDDDLPAITGDPGDYEPEWWVDDDAEWKLYDELLAPGPYDAQSIWNRRLLEVFTEKGDRLSEPREIDHMAYFPSKEQAERASAALTVAGFQCDDLEEPDEDDEPWGLGFHRADALADGRPDEFVSEILDIVLEEDGDYDGWGAPHVGPEVN
jgi:regulator of RNase E activity RraB